MARVIHPVTGLRGVKAQPSTSTAGRDKLVMKTRQGFVFVEKEEIQWIEAQGQHCLVHCTSEMIRIRKGIRDLEEGLDHAIFVRICRSAIVNLNHVRLLRPWRKGEYEVVMNDGSTLHWSRSFKARLLEFVRSVRAETSSPTDL